MSRGRDVNSEEQAPGGCELPAVSTLNPKFHELGTSRQCRFCRAAFAGCRQGHRKAARERLERQGSIDIRTAAYVIDTRSPVELSLAVKEPGNVHGFHLGNFHPKL